MERGVTSIYETSVSAGESDPGQMLLHHNTTDGRLSFVVFTTARARASIISAQVTHKNSLQVQIKSIGRNETTL